MSMTLEADNMKLLRRYLDILPKGEYNARLLVDVTGIPVSIQKMTNMLATVEELEGTVVHKEMVRGRVWIVC